MATTTDLTTLKINYLTQAQYDSAKATGQINDDELYFTPTSGIPTNLVNTITTTMGPHTIKTNVTGDVSIAIPTSTSHLTNDSEFITAQIVCW